MSSQNEVNRQKYLAVMAQVENLEETVADMETDVQAASELPDSADVETLKQALRDARQKLAEARAELTRLSDGCGRPHPQ